MAAGQKLTTTVKWTSENASIHLVNEVKLNLSNYWEFGSANQSKWLIRRRGNRLPGQVCRPRLDASA